MKAGSDSDVIIKGAAYSIRGEKTQWHNTVVIFFLSKLKMIVPSLLYRDGLSDSFCLYFAFHQFTETFKIPFHL